MSSRLAAALSGRSPDWTWWAELWDEAVAAAEAHGVLPLVAAGAAVDANCPPEVGARFRQALRRQAAVELVREHELRRLVDSLAGCRVRALLVKGADLAYSCYRSPELRPRTDTDLLIDPGDRDRAGAVLSELGYRAAPQSGGDLLMYQQPYRLTRDGVTVHVVDLHWRLFNPQRYGAVFDAADLWSRSSARPALSEAARGPSIADALIIACVHRVAHHFDRDRLIWLVDIRQITGQLVEEDWETFVDAARTRRVSAACLRSLDAALRIVAAPVPQTVVARLRQAARGERDDAAFFDAAAPHAIRVLSDLRLAGGWPARARLLRQHLFPPGTYMRAVYEPGSRLPLSMLYLKRILRGSQRWLRRA